MAEQSIDIKRNIKIVIGIDVVIKKPGAEDKSIHAHTFPVNIYSREDISNIIKEQKNELEKRLQIRITHQEGSGWVISKIKGFFITSYTQTPSRGSSFIPTPDCLNHPKLSLVNIKNDDQECFKWCMLYHQSEKPKNGERLTVLKKINDKYDWTGVNFPATFTDIDKFEENNKVSVNIYEHNGNKEINPIRLGTKQYIKNDYINLLLIKDENDNGHYVYIKKLEHLLHTVKTGFYKDRRYCPF